MSPAGRPTSDCRQMLDPQCALPRASHTQAQSRRKQSPGAHRLKDGAAHPRKQTAEARFAEIPERCYAWLVVERGAATHRAVCFCEKNMQMRLLARRARYERFPAQRSTDCGARAPLPRSRFPAPRRTAMRRRHPVRPQHAQLRTRPKQRLSRPGTQKMPRSARQAQNTPRKSTHNNARFLFKMHSCAFPAARARAPVRMSRCHHSRTKKCTHSKICARAKLWVAWRAVTHRVNCGRLSNRGERAISC